MINANFSAMVSARVINSEFSTKYLAKIFYFVCSKAKLRDLVDLVKIGYTLGKAPKPI